MNLELFSIVIAFCGFAFGLYQFHENSKIKRAETLSKLIFRLWSDEEIRSVVNMFEYNDNWFETDFHGTEKEKFKERKRSLNNEIQENWNHFLARYPS